MIAALRRIAADSFRRGLTIIAVGGAVLRVALAWVDRTPIGFYSDPGYFHNQGVLIGRGHWFVDPFLFGFGKVVPSAFHPPLYSLYLGAVSALGVQSVRGHRVASALAGSVTVVLAGVLARRLAGPRAGWIAGTLAAVYPPLWSTERLLASETLSALLGTAAVLSAYAFLDRPTNARSAVLTGTVALLTLTRAEGAVLFPAMVLPALFAARALVPRERFRRAGVAAVVAVLVLGPWIGFNLVRFHSLVISTSAGCALADSYCDKTFHGPRVGWWAVECSPPPVKTLPRETLPGDYESRADVALRHLALRYARDHLGELPRVVAIRVGRVAQLYDPIGTANLDAFERGRRRADARLCLIAWALVAPLAIIGAVVLRRRRIALWPIGAVVLLVIITAAVFYGNLRFRLVAEPALLVLTAAALDVPARFWRAMRDAGAPRMGSTAARGERAKHAPWPQQARFGA